VIQGRNWRGKRSQLISVSVVIGDKRRSTGKATPGGEGARERTVGKAKPTFFGKTKRLSSWGGGGGAER